MVDARASGRERERDEARESAEGREFRRRRERRQKVKARGRDCEDTDDSYERQRELLVRSIDGLMIDLSLPLASGCGGKRAKGREGEKAR